MMRNNHGNAPNITIVHVFRPLVDTVAVVDDSCVC